MQIGLELEQLDTQAPAPNRGHLIKMLSTVTDVYKDYLPKVNILLNRAAEKNSGGFIVDSKDVIVNAGPGAGAKTLLEVYVHEMLHAATRQAITDLNPSIAGTVTAIQDIREEFTKQVDATRLAKYLPIGGDREVIAKDILDYISNAETSLDEFIVYANTNHAVMETLRELQVRGKKEEYPNLAAKLVGMLQQLLNTLVGKITKEPTGNQLDRMAWLTAKVIQANSTAVEVKRNRIMDGVSNLLSKGDKAVAQYLESKSEEMSKKPYKKVKLTDPTWKRGLNTIKLGFRAVYDDKAKQGLLQALVLSGVKPEDTAMTILKDMSKSDKEQDTFERFGLLSNSVDSIRETIRATVRSSIKKAFGRKFTESEMEALSILGKADITPIVRNADDLRLLLEDRELVKEKIKDIEDKLKEELSDRHANYVIGQAIGLAKYKLEGSGSAGQLPNAYSIVVAANDQELKSLDAKDEVVDMVDMLASLYALGRISDSNLVILKELALNSEGTNELVMYLHQVQDRIGDRLQGGRGNKFRRVKGYLKEVSPPNVEERIDSLSNRKKLEKQGYVLVDTIKTPVAGGGTSEVGLYVSKMPLRAKLHRTAMRYTNGNRDGYTVEDIVSAGGGAVANEKAKLVRAKLAREAAEYNKRLKKGDYSVVDSSQGQFKPVLGDTGEVETYIYEVPNKVKRDKLDVEGDLFDQVGSTLGQIDDEVITPVHNKALVESIKADQEENHIPGKLFGKNGKPYVKVGEDSSEPEIKDLWNKLPKEVKDAFTGGETTGFYVRRDLLNTVMGFRGISAADSKLLGFAPETVKQAIRMGELIWKEVVKVDKVGIILKMPGVLFDNIVSNLALIIATGEVNVAKILQLQTQAVKELNRYIEKNKEVVRLEALVNHGVATDTQKRLLEQYKNDLEKNSTIKELLGEGLYTQIVEEAEADNSASLVTQYFDDKLKGAPQMVKTGLDWVFLTERTKLHRFMNTSTQYSDFVSRYAYYHLKTSKGMSKEEAIKNATEMFVNYSKPNSPFLEYANQMGFVMFTKYYVRIQRAIGTIARGNPVSGLAAIIGLDMAIGDVPMPTDSSFLVKSPLEMFYTPWDVLTGAVTPGSYRMYEHLASR